MQPRARTQRLGLPAAQRYLPGQSPVSRGGRATGWSAARSIEGIGMLVLVAAALLWPVFTPKVAHFYGTLSAI